MVERSPVYVDFSIVTLSIGFLRSYLENYLHFTQNHRCLLQIFSLKFHLKVILRNTVTTLFASLDLIFFSILHVLSSSLSSNLRSNFFLLLKFYFSNLLIVSSFSDTAPWFLFNFRQIKTLFFIFLPVNRHFFFSSLHKFLKPGAILLDCR